MNDVIATWLRHLAGTEANYNKLLDWLACAPDLDKPLCGLIFAGPPRTGKDLFVAGLRQVWAHLPDTNPILVYRDDPGALRSVDHITLDHYPKTRFVVATNYPSTLVAHIETAEVYQEIERRYLYMEHNEAAAEYLALYRDRPQTWADQEIAATVEGLNTHRKVERAGHLWIEGTPGAMRHLVGKKP